MTLRRTMLLALLAAVLLMLGLLVQLIESGRTARRIDRVSSLATDVTTAVASLDQLVYEYMLHPHERPAMQWRMLSRELDDKLDALEGAGGDVIAVQRLREKNRQSGEIFEAIVAEMKRDDPALAGLVIRRSLLAEQMLFLSRSLTKDAAMIKRSAEERQAWLQRRDGIATIAGLCVMVAMLAWLLWYVHREVLLRLEALRIGTNRAAAGDLDQRVADGRVDELGDLAVAFDRMLDEVRDSRRRLGEEEALRASEERQRQIIDALPGLVWAAQPDGRVDVYNRAWKERMGVDVLQQGFEWESLIHPDDVRRWQQTWTSALVARAPIEAEFRLRQRSGWRWHLARVAPLAREDGRILRWVGTATDIHQHKESEEHLRRSRNQAELLSRAGLDLVAELDPRRLSQRVIDTATALAGAELGALLYQMTDKQGKVARLYSISGAVGGLPAGTPLALAGEVPPDPFSSSGSVRSDDVRNDPRCASGVVFPGLPPGHPALVSYLAVPVRTRSGEVIGGLFCGHSQAGHFTDQHERLIAGLAALAATAFDNARLIEAERRHRRLADQRSSELARSNAELEQFAYICSHDMQEPLRMVSSFLGLLQERYRDRLDDRGMGFIARAIDGATRMQTLIRDILAFSRVGRGERAEERVRLREVVSEALANLQLQIASVGARIEVGEMPTIRGNRLQCVQLFQNFISNALKFSGKAPPVVRISAVREVTWWRLSVSDNGIGIDPAHHQRIFQIFQRLHGRDCYEGTGIGLSLCQKIVLAHGGRIGVDSAVGQGATFWFTLPDADDHTPPHGSSQQGSGAHHLLMQSGSP